MSSELIYNCEYEYIPADFEFLDRNTMTPVYECK